MSPTVYLRSQVVGARKNGKVRLRTAALAFAVVTPIAMASGAQSSDRGQTGFVYTETNEANNAVLVFNRAADGSLSLAATVPTGGAGGGVVSVGSQGTLALSQGGRWLFVANEGNVANEENGSISVMERTPAGLQAVGRVSSGGTLPVSITVSPSEREPGDGS